MTCSCSSSPSIYAPAGHVVTGNLKIITDYALRKLIMKGPSYREQNNINWTLKCARRLWLSIGINGPKVVR